MNRPALVFHPLKSPLARRLIVAIVLFSACVIVVMTAIQLDQRYRQELARVEAQFAQIDATHLPSLARSLWATDAEEVRLQVDGMTRLRNVAYVAVHEDGRLLADAGRRDWTRTIERRYPVRYAYDGQAREVGTLTVVAALDPIHQQLYDRAVHDLLGNALTISLVTIFLFALFHQQVTRHLAAIVAHLRRADPAVAVAPLVLARTPPAEADELDVLVAASHDMQLKSRAALGALRDSEARVRLLLDSTAEAIYGVGLDGVCMFANPACVRMLGYASEDDLIGCRIHERIHHTHADGRPYPADACAVRLAMLDGQACHRDDEVHWRADGSSFPVEYWSHPMTRDGRLVGAVVTFIDISRRKVAEAELHRRAYYDDLTGLPNRMLFGDRLRQALVDAQRHQHTVVLMMLDLDRFKVVNDTLGHAAGDALLDTVAARLRDSLRDTDTVARLGGDEFALLFTRVADLGQVVHLAERVLAQFSQPATIGGHEVFSTASVGIVRYPDDCADAESLLRFADAALYHAKEAGRNNYQFYSREMTASAQERLRLETELRQALGRGELFLHYQPQVDARSGRITGAEALLRWRTRAGLAVSPAQFIPLAEDTGLIVPIGEWVLQTACAQLRRWRDAGHTDLVLSVNVAPRQLRDPRFQNVVAQAVAAAGIPPAALELEITEGLLLENCAGTRAMLDAIKALGASLAIDDFGTGYSSLSYLRRFPIDRVKIDQSFVRELAVDGDALAIVRAIVALARAMRLDVIAEGVETAAQLARLTDEGCHAYQGYLFAPPLDADAFAAWLAAQPPARALSTDAAGA